MRVEHTELTWDANHMGVSPNNIFYPGIRTWFEFPTCLAGICSFEPSSAASQNLHRQEVGMRNRSQISNQGALKETQTSRPGTLPSCKLLFCNSDNKFDNFCFFSHYSQLECIPNKQNWLNNQKSNNVIHYVNRWIMKTHLNMYTDEKEANKEP